MLIIWCWSNLTETSEVLQPLREMTDVLFAVSRIKFYETIWEMSAGVTKTVFVAFFQANWLRLRGAAYIIFSKYKWKMTF